MTDRILNKALARQNFDRPPVWFMRQAGRYHSHYQKLRAANSFIDVCKVPELAAEATMGPIQDFDFDAAILFSDILFPLEELGIPLEYNPGPQLGFLLRTEQDFNRLKAVRSAEGLTYQFEAVKKIRERLPEDKSLIGFVGAPLTLYYFAVEGSHKNSLESAREGLTDGRFEKFCKFMLPLLTANMRLQAQGPVDAMAMFDTCAGDLSVNTFKEFALPAINYVLKEVRQAHPDTQIIYYSKGTGPSHWDCLMDSPIDCIGIDWRHDMVEVLNRYGDRFAIQGNFDPELLRDMNQGQLEECLREYFSPIKALPVEKRKGWICGLGHGVLPQTPEANVHLFIKLQREIFG